VISPKNISTEQNAAKEPLTRRKFISVAALSGAGLASLKLHDIEEHAMADENRMAEEIKKEKIRRAMLAGPSSVTAEATIAKIDHQGNLTVLRPGTNEWVCLPGDQNLVGRPDMALDPMGMVWFKDVLARKPKPTNTSPGLIYMLNGATQRSYTDPFDTTSPPIPIGPLRCQSCWSFYCHARRRNDGDVRWNAVRAPAHLWITMGGKRISSR
jgi:hypothetical protein